MKTDRALLPWHQEPDVEQDAQAEDRGKGELGEVLPRTGKLRSRAKAKADGRGRDWRGGGSGRWRERGGQAARAVLRQREREQQEHRDGPLVHVAPRRQEAAREMLSVSTLGIRRTKTHGSDYVGEVHPIWTGSSQILKSCFLLCALAASHHSMLPCLLHAQNKRSCCAKTWPDTLWFRVLSCRSGSQGQLDSQTTSVWRPRRLLQIGRSPRWHIRRLQSQESSSVNINLETGREACFLHPSANAGLSFVEFDKDHARLR